MPRFLLVLALFFSQSYFALCLSPKNIPSHKELVQTQHNNFNKKAFEKGMLRLHSRSSYTITENIYNSSIKISRKSGLRIESKKRQEALCSLSISPFFQRNKSNLGKSKRLQILSKKK